MSPTRSVDVAPEGAAAGGREALFPLRHITVPLTVAVLVAGAAHLTLLRFLDTLTAASPLAARYLENGFCRFIITVFVAASAYALLQAVGQRIDRRHLHIAAGDEIDEGRGERLLCLLSGREPAERDRFLAATRRWTAAAGDRERLVTLGEGLLSMREQHHGQIVAVLLFFVWVMPLLGFIGTVVGISRAIGGLEEVVQQAGLAPGAGLHEVLSGLQFAFDTTFVGLMLVIPTMLYGLPLRARAHQLDMLYRGWVLERALVPPPPAAAEPGGRLPG